jgi:hypothetical protein
MPKKDDWLLNLASLGTSATLGLVIKNNIELYCKSRGFAAPSPSTILDTIPSVPQIPVQQPMKQKQVHTQLECSDSLPCGANCYKDGKLWKIVCSEEKALYPHDHENKKKKKGPGTISVPPLSWDYTLYNMKSMLMSSVIATIRIGTIEQHITRGEAEN